MHRCTALNKLGRLIEITLCLLKPPALFLLYVSTLVAISEAQSPTKKSLEDLIAIAHFHVISFATWESIAELNTIKVCIDETHPFNSSLESTLSGLTTKNRSVEVEPHNLNTDILLSCHVAVLTGDQKKNKAVIERLAKSPVLTMASEEDITEYGGMVYIRSSKTPKFNLAKLKEANIRIDSTLLAISEIVNK